MYKMQIQVRYSETNQKGIVRLHQILEYFQDCGIFQSETLGLGVEEDKKHNRAWFLLAWDVKIRRYPRMSEQITVTTQAYKMKGFYGYRRYSIIDEKGDVIVTADSIWILMNTQKMLPMKISEEIADIYVEQEAENTVKIKRKVSAAGDWEEKEKIEITKAYLDTNNHVNNTFYALWVEDIQPDHSVIKRMRIDYRKAAVYQDVIKVFVQQKEKIFRVKYEKENGEISALVEIELE